jgi:glycosyltransferase involved in cell wall biosynthesis
MDNDSSDKTPEAILALQDDRVVPVSSPRGYGYAQAEYSTLMARELLERHRCDWVLPIDGDEYWHSPSHGSVRAFLETLPEGEAEALRTFQFDFRESELDDPGEELFLRRLRYCRFHHMRKVVLHRSLAGRLKLLHRGNHAYERGDGRPPRETFVRHNDLVRYHYPHTSELEMLRKILLKVEGYTVYSRGLWLRSRPLAGGYIWDYYQALKQGRFHEHYRRHACLSREEAAAALRVVHARELPRRGVPKNQVLYLEDMLAFFSAGAAEEEDREATPGPKPARAAAR